MQYPAVDGGSHSGSDLPTLWVTGWGAPGILLGQKGTTMPF